MNRLLLVAALGLSSLSQASAQNGGALAPTVPVVPSPVIQNGNLLAPAGGSGSWGNGGPRVFENTRWGRGSVTASVGEPVGVPSGYGYPIPPLPAGVGGADGLCGQAGCATARDRSCWEKIKGWLTYHPCKTELPKFTPTPYITPLQGMFPCTSVANCGTGCASGHCAGVPTYGQPLPPPMQPPGVQPMPLPKPMPLPGTGSGAVTMPPRGAQGAAVAPTWQGRVQPLPAAQPSGIAGYRFANPEAPAPLPGTVVGAGAKLPPK